MNDAEHLVLLKRIEVLMDLNPSRSSLEGQELSALVDEVHKFEAEHYPITQAEQIRALQRENKALLLGLGHALETIEAQANEYAGQLDELNRKLDLLEQR